MEAKLKLLIQVELTNLKLEHFYTKETLAEEQYATVTDSALKESVKRTIHGRAREKTAKIPFTILEDQDHRNSRKQSKAAGKTTGI